MSTFIKTRLSQHQRITPSPEPTVLVVDDEESVRRFVDRVLRAEGYSTVLASSGAEALECMTKLGGCDLLLTDLVMPHMRGDELAARLRHLDPLLKVLYLTGYADRLFKEKVVLWTDEAFLEKPTTVDGLREAVSLLLYGHTHGRPHNP